MTNFEFYTKDAARLGELIEKAVDDALAAKMDGGADHEAD